MLEPINPTRRHLVAIMTAALGNIFATASARADGDENCNDACKDGPVVGRCYFRGTCIRTPSGEVRIEDLVPGQLVVTAHGATAPVKRVRQPSSSDISICVSKGALGNGPYADLYVSPAHALFIDGVLIPAVHLVNGISIRESLPPGFDQPEYFHLEMENHELVFAQGVQAETLCKPGMRPCAPLHQYNGGRAELKALIRRLVSPIADVRDAIQVAYDRIAQSA